MLQNQTDDAIYITQDSENPTIKWLLKRPCALSIVTQMMWEAADNKTRTFKPKKFNDYLKSFRGKKTSVKKILERLVLDGIIYKIENEGTRNEEYFVVPNDVFTFEERLATGGAEEVC